MVMQVRTFVIAMAILAMNSAWPAASRAEPAAGVAEPALEVLAALDRETQAAFGRVATVRARAERGSAKAQHELGALLAVGNGARQDYAEAAQWFERAAGQGHVSAQFWLGNLYMRGVGVPRDMERMMRWWRQAALQGDINAQFALGAAYRDGRMVRRDLGRAHAWFFMASGKTGNAFANENRRRVAKRILNSAAALAAEKKARRFERDFGSSAQGGR